MSMVDPIGNLAASWHVYNGTVCSSVACWDAEVAPVLNSVPLVTTEIGQYACGTTILNPVMQWLDSHRTGYLAWRWDVTPPPYDACLDLISDYAGTPTSPYGAAFHDHLSPLGQVTTFTTGMRLESNPIFIAAGPDGSMWFTDIDWGLVEKITPAGVITEYVVGGLAKAQRRGGHRGRSRRQHVHFADQGAERSRRSPRMALSPTTWTGFVPNSGPWDVAAGPDGNMWFTDPYGDAVGKITLSGVVTEYGTTSTNGRPAGHRGRSRRQHVPSFTEGLGRVGKVTPAGVVTGVHGRHQRRQPAPFDIARRSRRHHMWFTERGLGTDREDHSSWGGDRVHGRHQRRKPD